MTIGMDHHSHREITLSQKTLKGGCAAWSQFIKCPSKTRHVLNLQVDLRKPVYKNRNYFKRRNPKPVTCSPAQQDKTWLQDPRLKVASEVETLTAPEREGRV